MPKFLKYIPLFIFLRNFFCKNLDVGQDFTEFIKISMLESLKKDNIYFYKKKKKIRGIFEILTRFNGK